MDWTNVFFYHVKAAQSHFFFFRFGQLELSIGVTSDISHTSPRLAKDGINVKTYPEKPLPACFVTPDSHPDASLLH